MRNRQHFQNQKSFTGVPHPTPAKSNHSENHNGDSADEEKPYATTAKAIRAGSTVRPPPNKIAALAYQIYLQEGRPEGRARQHWLEAEAQLAAAPPLTIKTELKMLAETTVKNEVGTTAKVKQLGAKVTV